MDPHAVDPYDYEHLQSCIDRDCWYCNDRPEPKSEVKQFLEAMVRGEGLQTKLAA